MTDKRRDRDSLAASQYKTATNVNARWDLYKYCVPAINIYQHALSALQLQGNESVLEVGCGDGSILLQLRTAMKHTGALSGLEINDTITKPTTNFLADHPEFGHINFLVGSADTLPLADNSQHIILAFFMLYHMPDIQRALAEWRRVLKPGGKLLVSTASRFNRPKGKALKQLMAHAAGVQPYAKFSEAFDLENGQEQLEQVFTTNKTFIYEGEMRIPGAEIYLRAMDSSRDMYTPVPDNKAWQKARATAKQSIEHEINENGYFAEPVKRVYFICE